MAAHRITHGEPLREDARPWCPGTRWWSRPLGGPTPMSLTRAGDDLTVPFTATWVLDSVPPQSRGRRCPGRAGRWGADCSLLRRAPRSSTPTTGWWPSGTFCRGNPSSPNPHRPKSTLRLQCAGRRQRRSAQLPERRHSRGRVAVYLQALVVFPPVVAGGPRSRLQGDGRSGPHGG